MKNKLILSYMAGFFDGEGYVGILKRKKKTAQSVSHYVVLSLGQKDGATMDWIVNNFGGRIHRVKFDGSYQWMCSDKKAYEVLKEITPFLKYKKPQAELAIKFYEERIVDNSKRFMILTEEELKRREEIYQQIKLLKKIFSKSKMCGFND
jgi:hypothetical protein